MEKAAFSLEKYFFKDIQLHLGNLSKDIGLAIEPNGVYYPNKKKYVLNIDFFAKDNKKDKVFAHIICVSEFVFEGDVVSKNDIPQFFYGNCIAIIFPYIRAFISTITLQANVAPLVLPTMNLSSLKERLMNSTIEK